MIDKGKVMMLLKGYATDGKDKPQASIDYDRIDDLADDIVKNCSIPVVVSSAMYKATFSFWKDSPRGGTGYWTTEIVPLECKNEAELKEKIATYLKDDHSSYHKHIKLKDIELM